MTPPAGNSTTTDRPSTDDHAPRPELRVVAVRQAVADLPHSCIVGPPTRTLAGSVGAGARACRVQATEGRPGGERGEERVLLDEDEEGRACPRSLPQRVEGAVVVLGQDAGAQPLGARRGLRAAESPPRVGEARHSRPTESPRRLGTTPDRGQALCEPLARGAETWVRGDGPLEYGDRFGAVRRGREAAGLKEENARVRVDERGRAQEHEALVEAAERLQRQGQRHAGRELAGGGLEGATQLDAGGRGVAVEEQADEAAGEDGRGVTGCDLAGARGLPSRRGFGPLFASGQAQAAVREGEAGVRGGVVGLESDRLCSGVAGRAKASGSQAIQ